MVNKNASDTHKRPVNLKVLEDVRGLFDRAAKVHGKTRSDFMIDCRASGRRRRACRPCRSIRTAMNIISPSSTSHQAARASND